MQPFLYKPTIITKQSGHAPIFPGKNGQTKNTQSAGMILSNVNM